MEGRKAGRGKVGLRRNNSRLTRFVLFVVLLMNSSDPEDHNVYSTRYAEMPAPKQAQCDSSS